MAKTTAASCIGDCLVRGVVIGMESRPAWQQYQYCSCPAFTALHAVSRAPNVFGTTSDRFAADQTPSSRQPDLCSDQTYANTDLNVELQNLQTRQKWQLTRHGDSQHLCQDLGVGTYQVTVTNPTPKPQPIAILKTNRYQMADRPLIFNGHAQRDASLIYLVSNQCD